MRSRLLTPSSAGASAGPGAPVAMVFSKWGGRPHWRYDAVLLGSDDHGTWLGVPAGTRLTRPGVDLAAVWVDDEDEFAAHRLSRLTARRAS